MKPLHLYARDGDLSLLRWCLIPKELGGRGADVSERDKKDSTALIWAAGMGNTHCVSALLEARAAVNARGYRDQTALLYASTHGYPGIVEKLLEAKADPNATLTDGNTSLILSVSSVEVSFIIFLCEYALKS